MYERAAMDHLLPPEPPADAHVQATLSGTPSVAIKGLFLLALFYTFFFTRSLLLPVVLAVLLSLILYPAVRSLKRIFIPEPVGAAIVVASLAALFGAALYQLFEPANEWVAKLPRTTEQIERKLFNVRKSMEQVSKAAEKVEALASVEGTAKPRTPQVVAREPSLMSRVLTGTQNAVFSVGATLVLLFFLLASGDLFMRKLVRVLPTLNDKKKAVALGRTIQSAMARYLFTITCINVALGAITAVLMHVLGMPNPLLWGVMVALLQYVPYIGPAISGTVLTVVAFITYEDLNSILLVPFAFFTLVTIEGQFITPFLTGRTLTLNPVMVFLSMLLWGWIWGVVGALMAVPILMTLKIFCDHIESLRAIGEFVSGEPVSAEAVAEQ
jgi:predicted PurR-regulated permease PerM